jgi:clan AA aspartic protease
MGMTTVTIKIKNPQNPSKVVEGDFLVDSGAAYTVVPQKLVRKLGIKPSFRQKFTLADGTTIERDIGKAFIEYQGRETAVPIVLGKARDSSLLGVLTLEALGLALDPFERKFYPATLML